MSVSGISARMSFMAPLRDASLAPLGMPHFGTLAKARETITAHLRSLAVASSAMRDRSGD